MFAEFVHIAESAAQVVSSMVQSGLQRTALGLSRIESDFGQRLDYRQGGQGKTSESGHIDRSESSSVAGVEYGSRIDELNLDSKRKRVLVGRVVIHRCFGGQTGAE